MSKASEKQVNETSGCACKPKSCEINSPRDQEPKHQTPRPLQLQELMRNVPLPQVHERVE